MTIATMILALEITLANGIGIAGILAGAAVVGLVFRRVVHLLVAKTSLQKFVGDLIARVFITVVAIMAILYCLQLLDVEIGPLLGGLTVFAVIIGYSLQPLIGNLIGSIILHSSRPIRPGDQVVTNNVEGTVIEVHQRSTEILSFDGVTVHIPNTAILANVLVNRTADFDRRTSIKFQVGFDTDLRKVQHVVETALRSLEGVSATPRADVLVDCFGEAGVTMVVRLWHPSEELFSRWLLSEVMITIQETLRDHSIDISYPRRSIQTDGHITGHTGGVSEGTE